MGSYKKQYEIYYSSLRNKKNIGERNGNTARINNGFKKNNNNYINKFFRQCFAAVILLGIILIIKNIPLKETKEVDISEIKRIIQKWYVLSVLTGRYSGSPESAFYRDIRVINEKGVVQTLKDIEDATLSDNFWNVRIPQDLEYTSTINPVLQVYLAAQVYFNDLSLLSNSTTVRELITIAGDIHHIFPKAYLKNNGYSKQQYNQGANYAYLDTQVNKSISDKSPNTYFKEAYKQCETKQITCGSIIDLNKLKDNLAINCIPEGIENMDQNNYYEFLAARRSLMAKKIREYYYSL